jgi:hypothetical protein
VNAIERLGCLAFFYDTSESDNSEDKAVLAYPVRTVVVVEAMFGAKQSLSGIKALTLGQDVRIQPRISSNSDYSKK